MKVELKDVKVELEIGEGKPSLYIDGRNVPIPREIGIALIFGDGAKPLTSVPTKPGVTKTTSTPKARGCQSPGQKKRLSESLLKYHAKRRRKEAAELKKSANVKPSKLNGKSHLNGAALHVN